MLTLSGATVSRTARSTVATASMHAARPAGERSVNSARCAFHTTRQNAGKPGSAARITRNCGPAHTRAPPGASQRGQPGSFTDSDQDPFDPAGIRGGDVRGHPVLAEDAAGHLHHDVVGLEKAVLQV